MTVTEHDQLFEKIRGLLRKAEKTPYEQEANTFFAKAQELMLKYRIDEATLWAQDPSRREQIESMEVEIRDKQPGARSKRILLRTIAELSSCRFYYREAGNCSIVVGFPKDLIWVEMLYTSVMKQASFKMVMAQAKDGDGINSRTFRNNFYKGFCSRLSERLKETYGQAQQAVAYTGSQALVLQDRRKQVDDWIKRNVRLSFARNQDTSTRNYRAMTHGQMAAETTDISGGSANKLNPKTQRQLNG